MSSTGEAEVKVPVEEVVPAAEEPKDAEKPVKEKKPRTPREKKPRQVKVSSHPPYFQMIKEAISSLNEKNGSSPYAIAKYMEEKHKAVLPVNFRKILALQLKNSTTKGKLTKIKASYKLSDAGKKDKIAEKKIKETRSTASKRKAVKKDETVKKKVVAKKPKKSTPAKPKQPKSIRSPAAKRAKRSVA